MSGSVILDSLRVTPEGLQHGDGGDERHIRGEMCLDV